MNKTNHTIITDYLNKYPNEFEKYLDLHQLILNKYPFLTIELKYNCPFYCFNGHGIFYITIKKEFEQYKFKKPQLFLGFMHGYKMYTNNLFLPTKLALVRYINITKTTNSKDMKILDCIGQAIEVG
jgi:hypothetical protein